MIGTLLLAPILMAPEIAEGAAEGAARLAAAAGKHLVKGAVAALGDPGTQAAIGGAAAGAAQSFAAGILASMAKTLAP